MQTLPIQPLGDKIVVKKLMEDETTASGIVLPDTKHKHREFKGHVVAVGPGRKLDSGERVPPQVKAGDFVYYDGFDAVKHTIDGVDYLVMRERDILGVIEA